MRSSWFLAFSCAAALSLTGVAQAQQPAAGHTTMVAPAQAPTFQGVFTYVAGQSDDVPAAIERCVSNVNFIIRPIARGRLKKTNQPYQRLTIVQPAGHFSIMTDARPAIVTPAGGAAIQWKRPEDGEMLNVSTAMTGSKLVQTFAAEDGKRVNEYTLSPDGQTLTMVATVSSGRLPKPLVYKLTYHRAS